jgi:CheY-like chemotaxis protein
VNEQYGSLTADSEGMGMGSTFLMELPVFVRQSRENSEEKSLKYTALDQMDLDIEAGLSTEHDSAKSLSPVVAVPVTKRDEANTVVRNPMKNILLVDDAITNRKVLGRLLKNNEFTCFEASHGQECLDMMKENASQYDLILMDYEMPVMNGPTATKILRDLGHKVPIIGLTGNVLQEDGDVFMAHGANAVLHKPLNITKFNEVIAAFREMGVIS